jgi:hypothetical protein
MQARSFMRKIALFGLFYGIAVFFLTCGKSPNNPYTNYDNCHVEFLSLPPDSMTFVAGDSVFIKIKSQGASLFDTLAFSINGKDSVLSLDSMNWVDTLVFKLVFGVPGSVRLAIKADLGNKTIVTDSMTITVAGKSASIVMDPSESLEIEVGAACSLSVAASGTAPIVYQWEKDGKQLDNATASKLLIGNFQANDTGEYFCIASNIWGIDSSKGARLRVKKETGKPVFWNFAMHHDTVSEGDSIEVRVDSLYTIAANDTASLKTLSNMKQASFRGDSLFIFKAGAKDSGSYWIPVVLATKSGKDTAFFEVMVSSRYCTLTLQADSGSVTAKPSAPSYRWGDTVSLTAVPKKGFLFVSWQGDAVGNDTLIKVIINKNMTIKAHFIANSSTECMQLTGGSLNKAIRDASLGSQRPKSICPEEGTYDLGTIKIWGKVRFSLEK